MKKPSGISILDFQISFSISQSAILLVPRAAFFVPEPFPTLQDGAPAPPGSRL